MARPRTFPTLDVFSEQVLVGRLWLDGSRRFVFQYDAAWLARPEAIALSHSIPLRPAAFTPDEARPFFANLLPESEVRRLITARLHISEKNDYALLEAIGGECAGAFSLWPAGHKPSTHRRLRPVTDAEFKQWLGDLARRPLMQAVDGLRLSLAGAQNKLPVVFKDGKIFLPEGVSASTHILKPAIEHLEDSTANESFCMRLAAAVGLPVPSVELHDNPAAYLLVERYDRIVGASGLVKRLHQEDFCQALGVLPENKYESEGGPGLADCFRVLSEESTRVLEDRRNLLRWVLFNVLIGNADAHAKNLALLRAPEGVRLAPFYDLLSTAVYPSLATKMAMKIGGENRPAWIQARHWDRLAEAIEVKASLVREYSREMAAALPAAGQHLVESFPNRPLLSKIMNVISENAHKMTTRLGG